MLIDGVNSVYMIDRDNAVYSVPKMVFPKRKDPTSNLANTLLDGVSLPLKCYTFFLQFLITCTNILVSFLTCLSA